VAAAAALDAPPLHCFCGGGGRGLAVGTAVPTTARPPPTRAQWQLPASRSGDGGAAWPAVWDGRRRRPPPPPRADAARRTRGPAGGHPRTASGGRVGARPAGLCSVAADDGGTAAPTPGTVREQVNKWSAVIPCVQVTKPNQSAISFKAAVSITRVRSVHVPGPWMLFFVTRDSLRPVPGSLYGSGSFRRVRPFTAGTARLGAPR